MIELTVQGDQLRLHSCARCDLRWWERNGEQIALDNVLALATVRR